MFVLVVELAKLASAFQLLVFAIVSVERDGTVITDVGPDLRVESGDELVIAGTNDGIRRFNEQMT